MLEPDRSSLTKTLEYEMSGQNRHVTCIEVSVSDNYLSEYPYGADCSYVRAKKEFDKVREKWGNEACTVG